MDEVEAERSRKEMEDMRKKIQQLERDKRADEKNKSDLQAELETANARATAAEVAGNPAPPGGGFGVLEGEDATWEEMDEEAGAAVPQGTVTWGGGTTGNVGDGSDGSDGSDGGDFDDYWSSTHPPGPLIGSCAPKLLLCGSPAMARVKEFPGPVPPD